MANSRWQKKYYGRKKIDNWFLKVKPGCKLKVRLVGDAVRLVRIFTRDSRCINIDSEETANKLKEKYPDKVENISVKYACWCFDRHGGKMKILEMPVSVFSAISNRMVSTGKKISDIEEGCDWKISTNGAKGIDVRYEVTYLKESCLTAIEQNMVADRKTDKKMQYDLTEMFPCFGFWEAEWQLRDDE